MPARPRLIARAISLLLLVTTLTLGIAATGGAASAEPSSPPERADSAATDATLTGLVFNTAGDPVDNVQVEAVPADDPSAEPVATDLTYEVGNVGSHGAYSLAVPAGRYVVRFSSPDWHDRVFETVYYGGGPGTPVSPASGQNLALDDVTLVRDTGAPVTGRVSGVPDAASAEVVLYRRDGADAWGVDSTTLGEDGSYTFAGVNRGRAYTVGIRGWDADDSPAFPATFLGQQPVAELGTTFTLPTGSPGTTLAPLAVTAGTPVSGTVRRVDGTPVAAVSVAFFAVSGDQRFELGGRFSDTPDAPGTYTARLLPGATYTVGAYDWSSDQDGYIHLGDTYDLAAARTFTVPTTGAVTLDPITLVADPQATVITGSVAVTDDSPLPADTWVTLYGRDAGGEWGWIMETEAAADGSFTLVRPRWASFYGELTLGARGDEIADAYLGGVGTIAQAVPFSQPAAGTAYPVGTLTVTVPRPAVAGTVLRGGQPAAGVYVELYARADNLAWTRLRGLRTAEDGSYLLRVPALVTEGGYTSLTVVADGDDDGLWRTTYLGGATARSAAELVPVPDVSITLPPIEQQAVLGVVAGRIGTVDGDLLNDEHLLVATLYRWESAEDGSDGYWSWHDSSHRTPGSGYRFTNVPTGDYLVLGQVGSYDGADPLPYLPTYSDGGLEQPAGPGSPGTFRVSDVRTPTTGPDVTLQRGVLLTGKVTSTGGTPLEGASVIVSRWVDGALGLSTFGSSGANGRYAVAVPAGADVFVSTQRESFTPFALGGTEWPEQQTPANSLNIGAGTSRDITLSADWGQLAEPVERSEHCLQRTTNRVEFAGHELALDDGTIFDASRGRYDDGPITADDRTSRLVVLPRSDSYGQQTWGVSPDGRTLCVIFTPGNDGRSAAQVLLTTADGGGLDVTYNYGAVGGSPAGSTLGHSEGEGPGGRVLILPGGDVEDGYADTNQTTGLVHGSLNSGVPGRYSFHFAGFKERGAAPVNTVRPSVTGDPSYAVGATLTAHPGTWAVDDEVVSAMELTYRWRSGGRTVQQGSSATYVVQPSDNGRNLWVEVTARPAWHESGTATSARTRIGDPAATNDDAPSITPGAGRVGELFTASPGTWTPAPDVTDLRHTYLWYADGQQVGTARTFRPARGLEGTTLTVEVAARADDHVVVRATSAPVLLQALDQLTWSTPPALGSAQVGTPIVLTPGTADGLEPSMSVRWSVGGRSRAADSDSGGLSYTPTAAEAGQLVAVRVTAAAPGYARTTWDGVAGPVAAATDRVAALTVQVRTGTLPVPGAWVTVCTTANTQCLGAAVDESGDHTATGVAGTSYRVTVRPPAGSGLTERSVTVPMPGDGSTRTEVVALTAPPTAPTNVTIPGNVGGSTPTIVPGHDQTFVVTGCATTTAPRYSIAFRDGTTVSGPMTKGTTTGDRAPFTAVVPAWQVPTTQFVLRTNVKADCGAATPATEVTVYIDPSGYVTDQYGRALPGAVVTLLRADGLAGPYAQVPDGSDVMSTDNRDNPSITDSTGFFRWDVTEGWYKVSAAAAGCATTTTEPMQVLPARVDLLVRLTCDAAAPAPAVAVSGTPTLGRVLTTDTAGWDSALAPTVQWLRDGVAVPGATETSYTVTIADLGTAITVRQSAARPSYVQEEGRGAAVAFATASVTSAPVTVRTLPAPTGAVSISGTPALGQTLTATPGTWSVEGLGFAHTWTVDGSPVGSGATFTVPASAVGKTVAVTVRASRAGYAEGRATSNPLTVAKVTPTLVLKAPKKVKKGTKVVLKVTLTASGVAPTGTVVVRDGKKVVGQVVLSASGTGKLTLKKLKKGKHKLVAGFAGSATLAATPAGAVTVKVA